MNTSIPLLAFGLFVLASLVLLHLAGGLVSRKRSTAAVLAELGVLFAFGVALSLYLETRKKERPLPGVELAAEGVNADSSRSLHVRAAPGTVLHCSSVFTASFGPDGTPLDAPAEWTVRFRADPAPGTAPVAFGADGKAVVTLPAACCDLVPDKAVRVWLDGKDLGITYIPATWSPADASHAKSAEGAEVSGWAAVFNECGQIVTSNLYVGMLRDEVVRRLGEPAETKVHPASNLVDWVKFPAGAPSPTGDVVVLLFDNGSARIGGETLVFLQRGSNSVEEVIGDVEIPPGVVL